MTTGPSRNAAFPLAAVVAWGVMFPVLASALPRVDALNLTTVRYALATLIFVALLAVREGRSALRPAGRSVEVVLLGVIGFAGFNVLTNLALGHALPQNIALFAATTPVVALLVRWARDGVRPGPTQIVLSLIALFGVGLVVTKGRVDGLAEIGVGELMMMGAVVAWAIYTHGASRFGGWSPLRYTALSAIAGTLGMLLLTGIADLTGWQHAPTGTDLAAITPQLAYAVLIAAVIAVLAWNTGAQRLGTANAALFMNLVPVVTFTVQIVRGYQPVAVELIGAAVTIAALVAANLIGRTPRRVAAAPVDPAAPAPVDPVGVAAERLPVGVAAERLSART